MYEREDLRTLSRIVNEFRVIEADFPASYMSVLAYIARHELEHGEYPRSADVSDHTGIARPSMSRILRALSDSRLGAKRAGEDRPRGATPALKLIERLPDSHDGRVVRLRVTEKGRSLLTRLADLLRERQLAS